MTAFRLRVDDGVMKSSADESPLFSVAESLSESDSALLRFRRENGVTKASSELLESTMFRDLF